jgi:DNA-binding LacI/PurR family transcriptional regulator
LVLDEALFLNVAMLHLARRGILSPEHVSLACSDPDPSFEWFLPRVAHISWDPQPVVRRIVGWVENVARGKDDRRQSEAKAEFVEGGTIGPAASEKRAGGNP